MLLGLDIGTSSAKAIVLSEDGAVVGRGRAAYQVQSPHPGWAESSPEDWWEAAAIACRQATSGRSDLIEALGLSGQMHGVVLCDEAGEPMRPAVLWADTRSGPELGRYRRLGPEAQQTLANPYVAGMAGPTLLWLQRHEPETYRRARWALQPKDWLRLRLTGVAAAEPSDASATLLYDIAAGGWAGSVVDALGLRPDLLAPIVPSATVTGTLRPVAADHLGLPAGLPVTAGAGDTAAAMLGAGLSRPGEVGLVLGTGGQIIAALDRPAPDPTYRTHLFRSAALRGWYAMAAMQNVGLAIDWARRSLGAGWTDLYEEAFSVGPGAGGVIFLPHLTGERTPYLDPHLHGAWAGFSLQHGRPHLLRAALEGVAFALRDGLEALQSRGIEVRELRVVGGGAAEIRWLQLLADVLRRPLLPDQEPDASPRGAALLAGLVAGLGSGPADEDRPAPPPDSHIEPDMEAAPLYEDGYQRYRALTKRLSDFW